MQLNSIIQERNPVSFPAFEGELVYMVPFLKKNGLPLNLKRWQPTVDAMLDNVDTDLPIYIMIDQSVVTPGKSHRRPGVHIDGYWNPGISAHGNSSGGHGSRPVGGHSSYGHSSVRLPSGHSSGRHGSHSAGMGSWSPNATYSEKEALLLASDVAACRAYAGSFDSPPKEGGDCSHVDLSSLKSIDCKDHVVYAGNVTMLHESLPIPTGGPRTLVRLNVPGWSPT